MNDLLTPTPDYRITLTAHQIQELGVIYRRAELALHPEMLREWLVAQRPTQVVGQPYSALGCLLASYLLAQTDQLWLVTQDHFWRLDLTREVAWWLPTWAAKLEQAELQMGAVLTAAEGLRLLRRCLRRAPLALPKRDQWCDERRGA